MVVHESKHVSISMSRYATTWQYELRICTLAPLLSWTFSPAMACAVCTLEFEEGEIRLHLECGHMMHQDCCRRLCKLRNWEASVTCPTCRCICAPAVHVATQQWKRWGCLMCRRSWCWRSTSRMVGSLNQHKKPTMPCWTEARWLPPWQSQWAVWSLPGGAILAGCEGGFVSCFQGKLRVWSSFCKVMILSLMDLRFTTFVRVYQNEWKDVLGFRHRTESLG